MAGALSQRRYISDRSAAQPNHALAGRADLRDGQPRELLLQGWVGRVWHPIDLPEGYHTPARGQSRTVHASVPSRAAPGLACGRAAPGRRDATRGPARKIVGDQSFWWSAKPLRNDCKFQVGDRDETTRRTQCAVCY
jgi:hypothetical protein